MKRLLYAFFLLLLALPVRAQDVTVPADGVAWQPFEQAVTSAQKQDKYVMVDIYAPWCGWCKKMQRSVYTDSTVQHYLNDHFATTRLDATAHEKSYHFKGKTLPAPQLAQALGLEGTPTTVFLKPDGAYLARHPGYVPADKFITMLRYIGSDAHEDQTFKEFSEDN